MPPCGVDLSAGDGRRHVCRLHTDSASVQKRGCGGGPDRGAGAENAVLPASIPVLCDHRKHADAVHRLQLPGDADRRQQAGTVLHPGDLAPAPHLRRDRAPAGAACGGRPYVYPHADHCGDGGQGIEGDGGEGGAAKMIRFFREN